jgi:hypothetical protein
MSASKADVQWLIVILGQISRAGWESKLDSLFFKLSHDL